SIRKAIPYFIGTHDFTSFCSAKTDKKDKVRTIYEIELIEQNDEIIFRFVGNGFLYNMVRIIVGTLLNVGQGKL
ncbi:tRNA pseudouridine(38-40) synthase TruA, partial [Xenorhabdus sp. M]|nr:tRNA pseudouridine(38-40) synthase TruA [Xenorhabdus sp. M]